MNTEFFHPIFPRGKSRWPRWQRLTFFSLGYFACAWLGSFLSPHGSANVSFWLPAGLFVAVLLLHPTREWPWLALAVLPANAAFDFLHDPHPNLALIFIFYACNVIRSVAGAWLVRRFVAVSPALVSLREFWGLMGLAGIFSAMIGAAIGAAALTGFRGQPLFFHEWFLWWTGSAMAVLVFTPILLMLLGAPAASPKKPFSFGRKLEAAALFCGLTFLVYYLLVAAGGVNHPKVPLLMFMLWAGLRFGVRGAALAIFWLALVMSFLTTHYLRGLSPADLASENYIVTLQIFLAVAAFVGLIPAIILAERERAMAGLFESEEKFSTAFHSSPDAMAISDLTTGKFIEVNEGFPRLYGYTRAEIIGHTSLELGMWQQQADREELVRRLSTEGMIRNHPGTSRHRSGKLFPALLSAEMVVIKGRACLISVVHDLTDQRRAETALRASEESLRATVENTPHVAVQWYDRQGRVTFWNHASENMYGWTAAEAMSKTLDELIFTADQAADYLKLIAGIVRDGQPVGPVEFSFHHRDGRRGVILSTLFQIHIASGEPRFVCMDVDLTQRKQAEALTQTQMQVLEMIATGRPLTETLGTLVRLVEAQSPEMIGSILLLDAAGLHVRHCAGPSLPPGYVEAIDGLTIGPCAGSCGTAAFRREPVFVADIATDPLWENYKELALKNGLRACWSTPIFDGQRNVLGTFAIYFRQPGLPDEKHRQLINMATHTAAVCISKHRTETEREQAVASEQKARAEYTVQLIAAQEAERTRIAGELHDSLGQNLLLIKNRAQLALLEKKSSGKILEQLKTISELATQSIAEARQISYDLHPYQLDHLGLTRAIEMLVTNAAQASGIIFDHRLEMVDDLFPGAAATNLYRITQESLSNILKHSRAKKVRLRLERDVREVQLLIQDDGCGFDPAAAGRGLGLKNIAERVRILGGQLKFDSQPGRGSRIEVTIPFTPPE
jgi:PAS domain S-box-containing protein